MKTPTDQIERLNWAASEELISRSLWLFTAFNMLLLAHAIWSWERVGLPFLAFLIVATGLATASFWTKWRFKFYVTALSYVALAIWSLVLIGKTHGKGHFWILSACFWGYLGYVFWKIARIVEIVYGPGWERERSLVKSFWQVLMSKPRSNAVIEFSWLLYTFRLLKSGQYWAVVVAVKHRRMLTPLGFGIRKLDEVAFMPLPDGKTEVRIGKRTFRATHMSPANPGSVSGAPIV